MTSISYRATDGEEYVGYLARPTDRSGAAVIIAHSAPGVGKHERRVADTLASLGYVALAADYQGDGQIVTGEALNAKLDLWSRSPEPFRIAMKAAHETLLQQDGVDPSRIGIIGYCSGGLAALEYARTGADIRAVVGLHSTLPAGNALAARAIKAAVLIINGTNDPFAPPASRAAFEQDMDGAGVDWQMLLLGGVEHGFTLPVAGGSGWPGVAYDQRADARSWNAMLGFLDEAIGFSKKLVSA
jgi:dienelactone hydrolase